MTLPFNQGSDPTARGISAPTFLYHLSTSHPSARLSVPPHGYEITPFLPGSSLPRSGCPRLSPEAWPWPVGTRPPSCPCVRHFLQSSQMSFTETTPLSSLIAQNLPAVLYGKFLTWFTHPGFLPWPLSHLLLISAIVLPAGKALVSGSLHWPFPLAKMLFLLLLSLDSSWFKF